jgi:Rrf2 family protein
MWSKRCTYGLRATLYLAARQQEGYVSIRQISDQLDIPYAYLTKVLQTLTQCGLLKSLRGPRGGVALARPAQTLTLKDIIEAIDGPSFFTECVLGLPKCDANKPCPLHDHWKPIRGSMDIMLSEQCLDEVARHLTTWNQDNQGSETDMQGLPFFESI